MIAGSWSRHRVRSLLAAIAIGSLGLAPDAGAQNRWTDDLIVELHAGAFARQTVLAQTDGELILLPIEETLSLLELEFESQLDGSILAALRPGGTQLRIDPVRGVATHGEQESRGLSVIRDWVPYAEAHWLARWLDVRAHVDLLELTVRLDPVDSFPVGKRVLRARSRRGALNPDELAATTTTFAPDPGWVQGAVLDWRVHNPGLVRPDDGAFELGLGSALAGGALELEWYEDMAGNRRDVDGSWHGVWPDERWVRQLELGRTRTTSPRGGSLRGFSMGNSPYQRRSRFGSETVRGQLPPNWEVEIYQYGRLIAFDTVDATGRYSFELPLDYGQNPIEIRAFGPHGEERVIERATRVDFDRLPAGVFEYGLSGGECPDGDCASAWNLDLRQGLHEQWTVRWGVEHFDRDDRADRTHPYAAMSGSLGRGVQLRASSVLGAQQELRLGFEPSLRLRSELAYLRFDDADQDPVWQPRGQRQRVEFSVLSRPVQSLRTFFVTADLQRRDGTSGQQWRSELGVRQNIKGLRGFLRWRESWQDEVPYENRSAEMRAGFSALLRGRSLGPLEHVFVRAETTLDLGRGDDDEIFVALARRLSAGTRLEVGSRWDRAQDDVTWTVGLSSTGSIAHWATTATGRRDETTMQSRAEGSLVYDHANGRVETDGLRTRGVGGLQGVVFEDLDGDGLRDPGEPGVGGVELVVGHRSTRTDEFGRYGVWQLLPYDQTTVFVDRQTIPNPLLVPTFERVETHVIPNGFSTLDVPLLRGAEVAAQVWIVEGDRRIPGSRLRVWLEGASRKRRYETRSFQDGEAYVWGVTPDLYQVHLDPAVLTRAGLERIEPDLYVEIPNQTTGDAPVEVEILLQRASSTNR